MAALSLSGVTEVQHWPKYHTFAVSLAMYLFSIVW